jgi:hypothetical protein
VKGGTRISPDEEGVLYEDGEGELIMGTGWFEGEIGLER